MNVPKIIKEISKRVQQESAKAILVGGSVRDHFLGLPIKDYDIEVYGITLERLAELLLEYGAVNFVGKSFGVLKFSYDGVDYDFSLPRLEKKVAKGHRGFTVSCDTQLSFKQASRRRDFTINAMGYDIQEQCFLDPYGGRQDIKAKVLRHIDDAGFVEDPLRVYRAVQFVGRFGYHLDPKTRNLTKKMVDSGALEELPKERIFEEFKKLLLKSSTPSRGFELMRELGILRYFPELEALIGVPQSKRWHPEGDVWIHTLMAVDQMAKLKRGDSKWDLRMMFATLCHDLGKATHTQIYPDRISAKGHEKAGVPLTKTFLYRLCDEHAFIESILPLVEYHLVPTIYYAQRVKDRTIRRLSTKVNIDELVTVARADFLGRTTPEAKKGIYEAGDWLLRRAEALGVEKMPPAPLILGRDLIALGLRPSSRFKTLLKYLYRAQLNGAFTNREEALAYLEEKHLNLSVT